MKAVQTKTTATPAKKNTPFFNKKNGNDFFASSKNEHPFFSQKNSFFKTNSYPIQTKLTVGAPDDVYEKEADATADKVVKHISGNSNQNSIQKKPLVTSSITPLAQMKCAACEEEKKLHKKDIGDRYSFTNNIQPKAIFESNEETSNPENVQRKCAACEHEDKISKKAIFESNDKAKNIQRKCAECDKKEKLQKKPETTFAQSVSSNIESRLNASKSSGNSLNENTRTQMESSFDADFSNVKIHNDSSAVQMSKDLNAQAFTYGSDIYFNSGKYDTNSSNGKHLLAHELTHVVQQGGAGNKAVAKKSIQRVSDYYWEPAPWNGTQEHSIIFKEINSSNVVTEAPIPNAQTDRKGIGSAAGDGKKGSADFYTSLGNTIVGLYFLSKTQPTNLAPRNTKLGGIPFTGDRAPVAFPGLTKFTTPADARKIPMIDKVNEAPKDILLGEMKPINSERAKEGVNQLSDYKKGIGIARDYVNQLSTNGTWSVTPGEISASALKNIVPDQFKLNTSPGFLRNCVLKGPQVENGKLSDSKLQQQRTIEAKLVAMPDATRPGIMVYAWVPKNRPTLREIPRRIVKLGKDVTDYIINPLKTPIKPKKKEVQKKEIPSKKPGQPVKQKTKSKIQKKDDEYFDFKVWDTHRKQLIKDFKAIKVTDDYKTAVYTGQQMEANKLLNTHMGIGLPAYSQPEVDTAKGLKSVAFWSNPLSVAFGYFKKLLGGLFNVVIAGYEKLKGWIKKIAQKFQFGSGKGGLIGSALKAVFNILKTVARVVISKVIDLLKLDIEKAIESKVNSLLEEAGLENARVYIDAAMHPLETAMQYIESWFGEIVEKYKKYFDEINEFIKTITFIEEIITKIRWAARAIACVSPPLVGCLWALAQEAIERIASWVVETCWFRKKIAPIVLKLNFVQQLSIKLYTLIKGFLKTILPGAIGEFFFPEKESQPEPAKESDIQCGSGEGSGDGESGSGEVTPEQEAVVKMQEDLGEEKFLALLDLLKKAKIDGATKMSAERIQQLASVLQNISTDEIKRMAEAYQKGDSSSVPMNIKDAIEQMAKDPKGAPMPVPELDAGKKEQEVAAADERADAAEMAKNLGIKEPTEQELKSSGEPALFLLNLLISAKNENDKLIILKKGKLTFNKNLRDRLVKMKSIAVYDLKIEVYINDLNVTILDVKHDVQNVQQVSIVLDITVATSNNPLIAAGTSDKTVQNILWDPAKQSQTTLKKPQVIKFILEGVKNNQQDLLNKEYDFNELDFKAQLTKINKIEDFVELSFTTTQINGDSAGIYDFIQKKYLSLQKGAVFMIKQNIAQDNDASTPVQPKMNDNINPKAIIQHKCTECEKEEKIHKKPSANQTASQGIESSLNASKGAGSALPISVSEQMQASFNADFSAVKIHNDSSAASMSKDLSAQAFTHGNDIYFNEGKYNTNSSSGKHLLAHELTHVLQQKGEMQNNQFSKEQPKGIQRWSLLGDEDEEKSNDNGASTSALDWVADKGGKVFDTVSEAGGDAADWAKEKGSAVVDSATEAGNKVVDWGGNKVAEAGDAVSQAAAGIFDSAKQGAGAIADVAGEGVDFAKQTAEQFSNALFEQKKSNVLTQLDEAIQNFSGEQTVFITDNQISTLNGYLASITEKSQGFINLSQIGSEGDVSKTPGGTNLVAANAIVSILQNIKSSINVPFIPSSSIPESSDSGTIQNKIQRAVGVIPGLIGGMAGLGFGEFLVLFVIILALLALLAKILSFRDTSKEKDIEKTLEEEEQKKKEEELRKEEERKKEEEKKKKEEENKKKDGALGLPCIDPSTLKFGNNVAAYFKIENIYSDAFVKIRKDVNERRDGSGTYCKNDIAISKDRKSFFQTVDRTFQICQVMVCSASGRIIAFAPGVKDPPLSGTVHAEIEALPFIKAQLLLQEPKLLIGAKLFSVCLDKACNKDEFSCVPALTRFVNENLPGGSFESFSSRDREEMAGKCDSAFDKSIKKICP